MKKVFLTFGSHNDPYRPHIYYASLLTNQVNNLNIFDEIKLYTSNDLINDTTFWKQHEDFILNNKIIPSNNYNVKTRLLRNTQNKNSILTEKFGNNNQ